MQSVCFHSRMANDDLLNDIFRQWAVAKNYKLVLSVCKYVKSNNPEKIQVLLQVKLLKLHSFRELQLL